MALKEFTISRHTFTRVAAGCSN